MRFDDVFFADLTYSAVLEAPTLRCVGSKLVIIARASNLSENDSRKIRYLSDAHVENMIL